jgi:hypothetical protein
MSGTRRHLGFRLVAQYWLSINAVHLGVPLMILGVAALIAVLAIPLLPTGPARQAQGEITGMGVQEDYEGSFALLP